ncbi:MAG TPA: HIT domain-containing protein [Solirubrobacteraceae bacterium]
MSERPLWAPWRIEYIKAPKGEGCVFCDPDPAHVIERGKRCFTILNTYPYAPGHVMVAPFRHVGTLDALSSEEMLELMQLARRAVAAQKIAMTPDGFNVGLNLGKVAGAGIADHLHLHVVPRWEGDTNFMPVITDTRVIGQALEASREALLEALGALE